MKGLRALGRVKAGSGLRGNPEKAPDGQIHAEMKMYWQAFSNTPYKEDVLEQLSRVMFIKTKEVRSEEDTFGAIRDVLERRWSYLRRKGIKNLGHILDENQRVEFCKAVRKEYEDLKDQQRRQAKDKKVNYDIYMDKVEQQWVEWVRNGKGRGDPEPVKVSRATFVKKQKRSRWYLHLQRSCGTPQAWRVMSFTGCFEPGVIHAAVMNDKAVLEKLARCYSACARVLDISVAVQAD